MAYDRDLEVFSAGGAGRPIAYGYKDTPKKSGLGQALSLFAGFLSQMPAQQEKARKREAETLDYYNKLRQSGYSAEAAEAKAREYGSSNFLKKLLSGTPGFQAPTQESMGDLEMEEKRADIGYKKSRSDYYQNRGTGSPVSANKLVEMQTDLDRAVDLIGRGGYMGKGVSGQEKLIPFADESEARAYVNQNFRNVRPQDLENAFRKHYRSLPKAKSGKSLAWSEGLQEQVNQYREKGYQDTLIWEKLADYLGIEPDEAEELYG